MPELMQTHWRARSYCEPCQSEIYYHYPIPEDRRIGLHRCDGCGEKLTFTPTDQSEFGQIVWSQLTSTIEFYDSDEPVLEIVLGEENA